MDCYDSLMKQMSTDIERLVDAEADVASSANRVLAELQTSRTNQLRAETVLACKQNAESMLNSMIVFSGANKDQRGNEENGASANGSSQTKSPTTNESTASLSASGDVPPAPNASIYDFVSTIYIEHISSTPFRFIQLILFFVCSLAPAAIRCAAETATDQTEEHNGGHRERDGTAGDQLSGAILYLYF